MPFRNRLVEWRTPWLRSTPMNSSGMHASHSSGAVANLEGDEGSVRVLCVRIDSLLLRSPLDQLYLLLLHVNSLGVFSA